MCNKAKLSQQFLKVAKEVIDEQKTKKNAEENDSKGEESKGEAANVKENKYDKVNAQFEQNEIAYPYAFAQGTALRCKDQCVAVIEIKCCGVFFESNHIHKEKRDEADKQYKNCDLPVIALVIESPHVDEFFVKQQEGYKERKPPRPAMGDAGENLEKYILGNLAKYQCINDQKEDGAYFVTSSRLTQGKYRLYLVNAVQYQCSLGKLGKGSITKERKNRIVNEFFNKYGKDCFVNRLKKIQPKIIINCCTKGGECQNRELVQTVINENFADCKRLIGYHPSSAHFAHGFKDT